MGKEEKEEEEMAKYNKEEGGKYNKEEVLRRSEDQTTCLVVVRPDGSSLLLRAEVIISCLPVFKKHFHLLFKNIFVAHLLF